MARIFASLAFGDIVVLMGTMALGFIVKDDRTASMHVALAVFAALLTCLVYVIALTFLIVAGKLTHQAVELGDLERAPRWQLTRLKAAVSASLAIGIVLVVATVATGATTLGDPSWKVMHQIAAWLTILLNAFLYIRVYDCLHEAGRRMNRTFEDYNIKRRRTASPNVRPRL